MNCKTNCINYESEYIEKSPYAGQGHDYRLVQRCGLDRKKWRWVLMDLIFPTVFTCPIYCKYYSPLPSSTPAGTGVAEEKIEGEK